jgi:membrane protease YdiL (CAAX protease family)
MAIHLNIGLAGAKCQATGLLVLLLLAPLVEETVFRLGLQRWLQGRINARIGPLSLANLLSSVVFAGLHVLRHGAPLMALTMMPALVFGWAWENSGGRLRYPVLIHGWYNLCLVVPSCL